MPPLGTLFAHKYYSYSADQTPEYQLITRRGELVLERTPRVGVRKVNKKAKLKARSKRKTK